MLILFLPFILHLVHCDVEVRQQFVTTSRVHLRFELITNSPDTSRTKNMNFSLFPRAPKTNSIHLNAFDSTFNYSVQLLEPFTKEPLGDRVYRQVHFIDTSQPWINETFTMASGVTLSVATMISCSPHFFGNHCETFCDGHMAKAARKRCDAMGRLRCDVGWMGPHCGQAVDPRKCGCQNDGICASSFVHESNSSTIHKNEELICECVNGFMGSRCEVPGFGRFKYTPPLPDACKVKDACLNGAQCFPNGPKVYCSCSVGFIGEFCEISLTTTTPTIEITATTSDYYGSIFIVVGIISLIGLVLMCIRYKRESKRRDALTRIQEPEPFAVPETKTMLVDFKANQKDQKVFTIEGNAKNIDEEEERYTRAPRNFRQNEYDVIQKKIPVPPSMTPPSIPRTCLYV
uniref:Delta-like protein n=1 Tax=Caenorhabditis tropicalis TaxID=1561998 RepID=A0A1I7T629_9PELO